MPPLRGFNNSMISINLQTFYRSAVFFHHPNIHSLIIFFLLSPFAMHFALTINLSSIQRLSSIPSRVRIEFLFIKRFALYYYIQPFFNPKVVECSEQCEDRISFHQALCAMLLQSIVVNPKVVEYSELSEECIETTVIPKSSTLITVASAKEVVNPIIINRESFNHYF
jgi:hypothetical protein